MSKEIHELLDGVNAWEAAVVNDGYVDDLDRVTITEAFGTTDAPILFPKVISRVLKEASEPAALITPLLDLVRLGQQRSIEIPAVNAIQAAEIPEGQEYPEQALAFAKQVEGKVSKKGVKVSFTDEVIADSLWDIVGLHVRAAGRAMTRLKEQIALKRFAEAASVVFDNGGGAQTTGRDINGAFNDTLTWDDVIDMAAVLVSEHHQPTDLIIHPLAWAVFLKDPVFHAGGAQVQSAWSKSITTPDAALNSTAPLGLNVLTSPFVGFNPATDDDPASSDVFLIDRNEVGVLLQREDMSVDEWTDQTRDIRSLKMKERYDIVALGDGEGITVAKDVALSRSYDVVVTNEMA